MKYENAWACGTENQIVIDKSDSAVIYVIAE